MASYARRPQVIEAYEWTGDTSKPIPPWVIEALSIGKDLYMKGKELHFMGQPVAVGDYVVNSIGGATVKNGQVFKQNYYLL